MASTHHDGLPLRTAEDVVFVRRAVHRLMVEQRFSTLAQTKMVTAASELARNAVLHGGGGVARLGVVTDGSGTGVRVAIEDDGPGIPDVERAMQDGFSTGGGLGLGLGGARRLVPDFALHTVVGCGTRVTITAWK